MNKSESIVPPLSSLQRRFFAALKDLREGRDPNETLLAFASALIVASRDAAKIAESQLSIFPKSHHIGQNRYGPMQEAFFKVGKELGLPMDVRRHPGGSTSYAVLEHERLRVTIASVPSYKLNPVLQPFRRRSGIARHRLWQLELLENTPAPDTDQVVATFVFGFDRGDKVMPSFLEARFVNDDHYASDVVDLLTLWKQAQAPRVEQVPQTPQPPMRKQKNFGIEG